MTPPKEPDIGPSAEASAAPSAVSLCAKGATAPAPSQARSTLHSLRTRPEFLRAASARRQGAGSFLVQARCRNDGSSAIQVGFTASKKIGNAVLRNRAKRRLREVARAVLPEMGLPGWDYVLVARPGVTVDRAFADLLTDLRNALRQLHRAAP